MTKKWVTLQLTERGESALENDPESILKIIRKFIKGESFVPLIYHKAKSYVNRIFLFRGYVFTEYDPKERDNYFKIMNTQYFIGPIMIGNEFLYTTQEEVKRMRLQLLKMTKPNIATGDTVRVIDGKYKNMEAHVTEYYPKAKEADLSIALKCMNIIVPRVPVLCLIKVDKNEER